MKNDLIQAVLVALEVFVCVKCTRWVARRKHRSLDRWTYLAFIFNVVALLAVVCLRRRQVRSTARRVTLEGTGE